MWSHYQSFSTFKLSFNTVKTSLSSEEPLNSLIQQSVDASKIQHLANEIKE